MKLAGYILAVYLLLLSAVPCCSFDNCPDDKMDLSAGTEQNTSHEEGDGDCGNCSPFFSCEGCAAAAISSSPASFQFSSTQALSVYASYLQTVLPSVEYDFWQPPKIG
jgi:sulfatase maturation enzyme AslB (radical SAM superfamily)